MRQLLDGCLPTLLAPGNVPALAADLPCEFVLLTTREDAADVVAHPAWLRLSQICSARVEHIDDLVFDRSHAVTITSAYVRAIRSVGTAIPRNLLHVPAVGFRAGGWRAGQCAGARERRSQRGVLAGNFQVVAEDVMPALRQRADPVSGAVALTPRQLLSLGLSHMHGSTALDVVGNAVGHQRDQNRLFWRVDRNTLIGRFYLLHMIAIRPERTEFEISSACDYSFIPELCPSNNVVVLTDSDDYLMVEMHARASMPRSLAWGHVEPGDLGQRLSEWTTARHR